MEGLRENICTSSWPRPLRGIPAQSLRIVILLGRWSVILLEPLAIRRSLAVVLGRNRGPGGGMRRCIMLLVVTDRSRPGLGLVTIGGVPPGMLSGGPGAKQMLIVSSVQKRTEPRLLRLLR